MVVCLSRTYRGTCIDAAYCLNPLTGEQLPVSVTLRFSENDIEAIYNYERIPDGSMQEAVGSVFPTGLRLQFEREKERVTREAAEYALANSGAKPGEALTPEQMARLPELMVKRLSPFIQRHRVRQPRRPTPTSQNGLQSVVSAREKPSD